MTSPHAALRRALGASLVGLLLLTACGDDDDGGSSGADDSASEPAGSTPAGGSSVGTAAGSGEDARAGGRLTLAYANPPSCIDPHQLADALTITVGRQFTDSLTFQDPETGEILPALAESWEISEDGTTYTFTLRDGVTFSDGTPVDAEAVVANVQDIVDLGAQSLIGSSYVMGLETIEALDESTVRIVFAEPSAQFLQATSTATLGLLAPATLEADLGARCNGELIGSGPFVIEEYVNGESITLTKRPDYDWAPAGIATHDGPAYLDSVTFQVIAEPSVRTGALQSGQVQGVESVQPVDQEPLAAAGYQIVARSNPGMVNVLIPNVERPALAELPVRQALQKAIDRQTIIDTLWNDNYAPATSVLAATTPYYADLSAALAYDPDGANALLDYAGWVRGSDGIRERDGQRLHLDILLGSGDFELLQQQFAQIGVELGVRQIDPADYVESLNRGEYDLAPYNLTRPDPSVLTALFSSTLQNVPHFPEGEGPLDEVLAELSAVSDPEARAEVAAEAQRRIVEEAYALPTTEQAQVYAFAPEVQDVYVEASSRLYLHGTWLAD